MSTFRRSGPPKYDVMPRPKQRGGGRPDKWVVQKNRNTVSTHNKKSAAVKKARRLAKKNDGWLRVFKSTGKGKTESVRYDRK